MIDTTRLNHNPYVGPRAFLRGETLYGRDREVLELLDLLIAERIVLLYSPSGAGKTSLIQAALIPELEEESFEVLPAVRVSLEPPQPTVQGANRYVMSILLSLEETVPSERQMPLDELATLTLNDYLERRDLARGTLGSLVLVFDQFEEILTVDLAGQAAKSEFFEQLGRVLRDRGRWALFAMREEFLAGLDPYLRALPTRLDTTYRLELLGPGTALEAIQQPARQAGVEFTDAAALKLVDDLRLVRVQLPDGATTEQPGPFVEPVQLQLVCRRLWDSLRPGTAKFTEADISAVGDVDSALAAYYADLVAAVAVETGITERAIRDWFDGQLITEQGIRGQVLQGREQSGGLDNRAIWPLVDAHLVRAEQRRGATWFELAHDRLVGPVQADNTAWREKHTSPVALAARAWDLAGKDPEKLYRGNQLREARERAEAEPQAFTELEREFIRASAEAERTQSARRLRLLLGGAGGLLLLFSRLLAWAVNSSVQTGHQKSTAEAALALAEAKLTSEARLRAGIVTDQARQQLDVVLEHETRQAQIEVQAGDLEATVMAQPSETEMAPAPTWTPTHPPTQLTPTGTPGSTAVALPTSTSTPVATPDQKMTSIVATRAAEALATDRAVVTQLAQVRATQTAEARCPYYPKGEFVEIWQRPAYNKRLGCPVQVSPINGYWAEQPFESGQMYWVQVPDWFFVTIGQGKGVWHMIAQSEITWPWTADIGCKPDRAPGPSLVQPIRGFGGVWCFLNDVKAKIGFATATERGVDGNLLQEFEGGFILRDSMNDTYIMFRDAGMNSGSYVRE